ncbi:M16 family metallopeptidase [Desertivirga brevis]|uniref:M16 family metallopeptidase n=1 Tax=Desertivirga brevis TaxID=2810310 RepID=UPI001A960D7B|nr:M16 family metallopeptidase [Pedobacter sp. SYSU D00873]
MNNNKVRRFFVSLLLVSATSVSSPGFSQTAKQWSQASEGGYTYRYVQGDPMKTRFYTLKNGLSVMLSVNITQPRIQTYIAVRAGSNNDPKDHTGLAHYLEHLLFKGTDKYGSLNWQKEKPLLDEIEKLYDKYNHTTSEAARKRIYHQIDSISGVAAKYAIPNEYDKIVGKLGAQGTNAHTWVEETVYKEDIPSTAIDKFLTLQSERFRFPVFRLFHTELEAVYEEKNRGLDNDNWKINETMMSSLFPTHNYGQQTTIGTVEHLKNPSLIAIRKFYNTWYVPNNMAVIMSGDFDPSYVIKKLDAAFAWMKAKPVTEYKPAAERAMLKPVVKEVLGPDAESVNIGFRLPGATDRASVNKLNVIADLLNNGKAGLIDEDLNRRQKVLQAGAYVQTFKDYSVFTLYGKARQGQSLEEVKDLLFAELQKLKKGEFKEQLLKAIVDNARLSEMQALDNNENRVDALLHAFIQHKGQQWPSEVSMLDDMAKVKKAELVSFASNAFANNFVIVYKRKGVDNSIVKVIKPQITPVTINRNDESDFSKQINNIAATEIKPEWVDYDKEIQKGNVGIAPLYYVKNKENSIFRLYYKFDSGSWNNKVLPYAAAYLRYLGTDSKSVDEINAVFYNLACSFNVSVENEETTVSISGLQENFDKAVALFEDLLQNCKTDENALASLKQGIQKSRDNNKLNKSLLMRGLVNYAMYGPKNPFNYQLTGAELNELTSKNLTDALHTLNGISHKVLYYGPADLGTIQNSLEKLHRLPTQFRPLESKISFNKVTQESNKVYFANYDMVQSEIYWVRNDEVFDKDRVALVQTFNTYFGGGMGSIVFQTIRESKALAYSTFANYSTPSKKGERNTVMAYVGSQSDKMAEAVAGMNELLDEMPESVSLLDNAKLQVKQDIETQRISKDGIIFSYLANQKLGIEGDNRKDIYMQLPQLNMDAVKTFHNTALRKKPYSYCVVAGENKVNFEDLKKYGEVVRLSPEVLFGY